MKRPNLATNGVTRRDFHILLCKFVSSAQCSLEMDHSQNLKINLESRSATRRGSGPL